MAAGAKTNDPIQPWVKVLRWEPEHDRPGKMRAFDDLYAAGPISGVRVERMEDNSFWMEIRTKNRGSQRFFFMIEKGALVARTEDDD